MPTPSDLERVRATCASIVAILAVAGLLGACGPMSGSLDASLVPQENARSSLEPASPPDAPADDAAGQEPAAQDEGKAASVEAKTRPFEFDAALAQLPDPEPAPAECGFPGLPAAESYRLYAAGDYGGRDAGFHIDRSGHEATRMDVVVNEPDMPVALMLGSYEPTVWSIGWTEGTRIAAVLVGGYHHQAVTGLPPDVPLLVSTHDGKGVCGYFYVSARKPETLVPVARRAFARSIDMVYPALDGRVVVGKALAPGAQPVTDAGARAVESFRIDDALVGGPAGLAHAVRRGWLRPASRADADAWHEAVGRLRTADIPPVAGGRARATLHLRNAYVVLQGFELPPGLYGANSATLFVPEGIPRPAGNPGHSTIYDFNTLTCSGAACDVD